MLEKITQKFKERPLDGFLYIMVFAAVIFFALLLSFTILQSDDYGYSTYFAKGIFNFLKLTKEHFLTVNGRALVHFFLHITLALPAFAAVLIKSAVLFFTGFFSFKVTRLHSKHMALYLVAFYAFFLLMGNNTLKETLMWTSGFFNYIFPALFVFVALYLHLTNSKWQYLFCFLSGATTEQWGISAFSLITACILFSRSAHKRNALEYLPSVVTLLGYGTIFMSPATLSRISVSGHTEVSESLFDITRLSQAFFKTGSVIAIIVIFISAMIALAYFKKGAFKLLYTGALPLFLILTIKVHSSYMAPFIVLICYLLLCGALLFKEGSFSAIFIFGALSSILIMLPTNTFDYRITFPSSLLLMLSIIYLVFEMGFPDKITAYSAILLLLASLIAFYPSFKGFYGNHLVEKDNLEAIKKARETKILSYSIDYNKNYAIRQMFNDGWFYRQFISLYSLEDCTVYLDSENAAAILLDEKPLKAKAIISEGEAYVPLRAFINEAGGTIKTENGTDFIFNGNTLTYLDGMLMYKNSDGHEKYLVADDNSLPDFYTLYIKLDLLNTAFNISVSVDNI